MTGTCECCERDDLQLTRHHLIPKATHKRKKVKEAYTAEERNTRIILVCRSCHNQIHALIEERELERDYNTREELFAHPGIAKYRDWIRTRRVNGKVSVRRGKK